MTSVLVLGGTGQVGHEVARALEWLGPIAAPTRRDADLTRPEVVRDLIRSVRPAVVVNAAAYTAVDAAESDRDACFGLNADLPEVLARECREHDALLVHFSSDYVYDGAKRTPYVETDAPNPLSVYGASKLAGDEAIRGIGGRHLIFRTSWVYAARGRNFARTMLRLAHEREEIAVVNDQIGAPTSARAIADGVSSVLRVGAVASGVYHMTAAGETTWFEFAAAILADDPRAADQRRGSLRPITTAEYPTAAARPAYSVLDNTKLASAFGVRLPSWRAQWSSVAAELRGAPL